MSEHPIRPRMGRSVYIAPTAVVCGEVELGDGCVVMHHVVIRGDVSWIRVGARVNIQDGSIVHTKTGVPLEIEDDVAIGHRAVVHCRRVGRGALIGIGAIVLDDAEIGPGAIVAAGALVPPGARIPEGRLAMGVPARVIREVTDAERNYVLEVGESYQRLARLHAAGVYPPVHAGV